MSDCDNEFENLVALLYIKYDTMLIKDPSRVSFIKRDEYSPMGQTHEPEDMNVIHEEDYYNQRREEEM